ncbi:MAG: VanW family protein [Candidatus Yanofskybacteria bacterium]|nr:VanW family protein [Candidatus Yanofskybacteria bacterium]
MGKLIYRLVLTGLIVLAAFNFGSFFYIYAVSNLAQKAEVRSFASILENATAKDLSLKMEDRNLVIKSSELKEWLEKYERSYSGEEDIRISSEKVYDYLKDLAVSISVEPVNANLVFEGGKASTFRPAVEGIRLDIDKSALAIITALENTGNEAELTVIKVPPTITLEKINDLGIETLVASGESNFAGSSQARIHNLRLGASKYNGLIVKPGEEFSFNDILGKVDETGGYQAELVIKSGELIPEYGGGLCQVSTTMFRAAVNAGLPILERRPHSFPVKYYNPQGFDATIYPGVVDLKFRNDTPAHLLIQTKISGTKLIFEIYGSNDGRVVTMDGPYQYDQKPNGSMKAYFMRKIVSNDGTETEERFDSNYKPPMPLARNPLE